MKIGMNGIALAALVITGAALAPAAAQASTETYTFNNVALSDGGDLNGTITTADFGGGNSGILNWNLLTSGGSQPGEAYVSGGPISANSLGSFTNPTGFDFFAGAFNIELQLSFSGNLITGNGVTLLGGLGGPSWECNGSFNCPGGPPSPELRYVSADVALTETPLPASWTMMLAGIAGLGFFAFRRRKNTGGMTSI